MSFNERLKNKRFLYSIVSLFVIVIVIVSVIGWKIWVSDEVKVTVLNLSGKELEVCVMPLSLPHTHSSYEGQCLYPLNNNDSGTLVFRYTDYYLVVETMTPHNTSEISRAFYQFQNNELYDLLVIVQNDGENITITKMPDVNDAEPNQP